MILWHYLAKSATGPFFYNLCENIVFPLGLILNTGAQPQKKDTKGFYEEEMRTKTCKNKKAV